MSLASLVFFCMDEDFTIEEKYLHEIILHSNDNPDNIGLFNGQAGVMLVLAHYAHVKGKPFIENVTDFLLDNIISKIHKDMSIFFADGLSGIGWSIEYLVQNGYLRGSTVDICADIDQKIMSCDIRRIKSLDVEDGLGGLMHYIVAHIQSANNEGRSVFDSLYLSDLFDILIMNRSDKCVGKWINLLSGVCNKESSYRFNLKEFIKPMNVSDSSNIGLQCGLAGLIELNLEDD